MDERRLPFLEHLRDLRGCLRNSILALIAALFVTFWWSEELYALLARPLVVAWQTAGLGPAELNFGSLIEPFWVYFELALYAGIFLASPVIFYQLWRFIAPGLYDREKRVALPFAVCSALCFVGGAVFCYELVFPFAFRFFLSYSSRNVGRLGSALGFLAPAGPLTVRPVLFMQQYLDLATKMLLGFGLVFELPMLSVGISICALADADVGDGCGDGSRGAVSLPSRVA